MKTIKLLLIFISFVSCKTESDVSLKEKLSSKSYIEIKQHIIDDSVVFNLKNNLTVNAYFYSKDNYMDSILKNNYRLISGKSELEMKIKEELFKPFNYTTINPFITSVELPLINLPFKSEKKYKILQGYNGSFSHNKMHSRFAIDFKMPIGDTVCAAFDGIVIEIVNGYRYGGTKNKWRGRDNFIWIYHPKLNLISSYAHLKKSGTFVNIGDTVYANQAIGLSGNTGYSSEPHLHFHMVKLNANYEYESVPYNFLEGYNGNQIKKGDFILKKQ